MVIDPDPGVTTVNGAIPSTYPTPPVSGPLTIGWNTTGFPSGSYLAVFEAAVTGTTTQKSQIVVMIKISQQYKLTLTAGANGTVSPSGTTYYDPGTSVQISATANQGYYFNGWSDAGTGNPRTLTMNQDYTISATFTQTPTYTLTTSVSPAGAGTVTSGGSYSAGTHCTLTATASTGYNFSSWSGLVPADGDSSSGNTATVVMNSSKTITANFNSNTSSGQVLTWNIANTFALTQGQPSNYILRITNNNVSGIRLQIVVQNTTGRVAYTLTLPAPLIDGRTLVSGNLTYDVMGNLTITGTNFGATHMPAGDYLISVTPNVATTILIQAWSW